MFVPAKFTQCIHPAQKNFVIIICFICPHLHVNSISNMVDAAPLGLCILMRVHDESRVGDSFMFSAIPTNALAGILLMNPRAL